MSHSSSRKRVLDDSLPLAHRASHARSCVNHVAARLSISREQLMELLAKETGVDLNSPGNRDDLLRAFQHMESLHVVKQ